MLFVCYSCREFCLSNIVQLLFLRSVLLIVCGCCNHGALSSFLEVNFCELL